MNAGDHLNPQSAIGHPLGVLQSDRPARILIADDDATMRELLTAMVEGLGHEAVAVPDGGRLWPPSPRGRPTSCSLM